MKVDSHAHLWDTRLSVSDVPFVIPDPVASADDLIADMQAESVSRAVLVQPMVHGSDHALLQSAIDAHPGKFVGFGLVDADASVADLERAVDRLSSIGLRGVRIHLVGQPGAQAETVARTAREAGLALELHVDESGWHRLPAIIEASQDNLLVIDHLARPLSPRGRPAGETLKIIAASPNAVVKLAALDVVSREGQPHADAAWLAAAAIELLGPDRLMWGSNFPWCRAASYGVSLRVLESLALEEDQTEAILGGTANRLFFDNEATEAR